MKHSARPVDVIDIDTKPEIAVEIPARVEMDGSRPRLVPSDPARWLAALARMAGCLVTVTLSRAKKTRSNKANAYLWAVVYKDFLQGLRAIAQDAKEPCVFKDEDELHEAMKYRFLGLEVVTQGGVSLERPSTTTKLNPAQFSAYVDQVKALAAERWSIYVREAGERVAV